MSKINTTTKIALVLTGSIFIVLALYIIAIYICTLHEPEFPVWFTYAGLVLGLIAGGIGLSICIIGVIWGFVGIFANNARLFDRITCIACTLLFLFLLCISFSVGGGGGEKSRRISCSSNLKQISLALKQYAEDFAGYYPPSNGATGLEVLRKNDYLTDYTAFACPSTATARGKDKQPLTEEIVDYVYFGGLNTKSDPELPLVCDKANNHQHFVNVLFVGGTTKGIEGNPWTANIKK